MRLILIFLITLSLPAFAQVYKWTDESGVTHFGSQPPPGKRQPIDVKPASGAEGSGFNRPDSQIIRRAQALERQRLASDSARRDSRSKAEAAPENSWSCEYERERVEEYKIELRELGRKGYKIWEKDQLESQLREAERQAQRDCS